VRFVIFSTIDHLRIKKDRKMNKIQATALILSFAVWTPIFSAQAKIYDLILVAGQSNAQGWMGDATKYPADPEGLDAQIPFFWASPGIGSSQNKWVTLGPQEGRFPAGHFGPEIVLARDMKSAGFQPAVFKFTIGGTSLGKCWKQTGEGGLYDQMIDAYRKALDEMKKRGDQVRPLAFVWIQGESDSCPELADAYYGRLCQMIHHLRNEVIHTPNLPIILGIDEQHPQVRKDPTVLHALQQFAQEDPHAVFTSMLGLEKADGTHLKPNALPEHGHRLYRGFTQLVAPSGEPWPGKKSERCGFTKYSFTCADTPAWIILPKEPAPGNPWVWRGRWANFHIKADNLLLQRGFRIAYINTQNMLGCPEAMDIWDRFYETLTNQYGLSPCPALEAVSRGGLFVFHWAAHHPKQVACIYSDSAVFDIKSWPLGSGRSEPDSSGLSHLKKYYGMETEEQIRAYDENPIDPKILEPIAQEKIPVLALVNPKDGIVPPEENTFIFAERYQQLGAPIQVITLPEGVVEGISLKGHHFPELSSETAADFIEQCVKKSPCRK
jgi:pimeloyl-ACP methyl ester carboxylesterase